MTLLRSAEQDALSSMLHEFLARRSPLTRVREVADTESGYDTALWRELAAELGLAGLAVPTEFGGSGAGVAEVATVMEELGALLTPLPYFSSAVLSGSLLSALAESGSAAAGEPLAGVADGSQIASTAYLDAAGRLDLGGRSCTVAGARSRFRLSGERGFVPWASVADLLLVPARHDGRVEIFAVRPGDAGVRIEPLNSLDITARVAHVSLHDSPAQRVSDGSAGGASDAADVVERAFAHALVGLAAGHVGGIRQCLADTVAHVSTRRQFGRTIGSFQAVKHGCAQMYIHREVATAFVRTAAQTLDSGETRDDLATQRMIDAETSALYCADAYKGVASSMIQYLGGTGYSWEASAHLYYKRAWTEAVALGDHRTRYDRLADHVQLSDGESDDGTE